MLVDTVDISITTTSDDGTTSASQDGLELDPNPVRTTGISPSRVSPIAEKLLITVQLYDEYPIDNMSVDDFTVTMVPVELELSYLNVNNDGVRALKVVAVDTTSKTITIKYGGAYSGTYDLVIKSKTEGNLDTTATQLQVVFELLDVQPRTGSIYGGTKLTITGGPFTTEEMETVVKVGGNW